MPSQVIDIKGYIAFKTNRYRIHYGYMADILTMKATQNEIRIYSPEPNLIASHERSPVCAGITLDQEVRAIIPEAIQRSLDEYNVLLYSTCKTEINHEQTAHRATPTVNGSTEYTVKKF